jgi:hypothetical protein
MARLAAMLLAVLGVVVLMGAALNSNVQPDADAYWLAAQRLRDGTALYGGPRGDETEIYRYAPWFAFAWLPLTYLGQDLAYLLWRALLALGTLAAVWPLLRRPSPAALTLAILLGGLLLSNLPAANVTPLLVGALAITLRTRAGPMVLGIAGSLKIFPLLLVAGYLAERRWRAALVALAVSAVLWSMVLAFDLATFLTVGSADFYVGGVSLYAVSPIAWMVVAAAMAVGVAILVLRRSRWAWLVSSAVVPVAVPRVWLPEAGYLLAGIAALTDTPQSGQERR